MSDQRAQNLGKIPPHSTEVEKSILGAILLEKNAIDRVVEILKPDFFYLEAHKEIYKAMLSLFENSEPIDIHTLYNKVKKHGKIDLIGGPHVIAELTNNVASSANIEYHAKEIEDKAIKRYLVKLGSNIQEMALKDTQDSSELLSEVENRIYQLTDSKMGGIPPKIGEFIPEVIKEIEEIQETGVVGIPSYKIDVDQVIGGYRANHLNIFAARPGQGKTAKALEEATDQAINRTPVAYFSLEMGRSELLKRIYANKAEIITTKVNNGKLAKQDWEKIKAANSWIEGLPLFIDDEPSIDLMTLRSKLRKLTSKENIRIAYVDYLQLMAPSKKHQNREGEISEISRGLKGLAKELEIPIVALSQLNREVDKRTPPKPKLSDLRESGSIEQDADLVMFLYWPKSYGRQIENEPNLSQVLIYKNRHGALREVTLSFFEEYGQFKDYQSEYAMEEIPY